MNMIEFGLSDFSLVLGDGEKLKGIKSILCYSNETFRRILEDPQVEDPVPLPENISKESMMLLFKYYGGGQIEIDECNVSGLLLLSLYYNEKDLFLRLRDYAINHMNENIVKDLLNNEINIGILDELYDICDNYIRNNVYLMIENEILNDICMEGLKRMLSFNNILIRNENTLLDSLLKYYKVNRSVIENSTELKSEFNELLEYVDWSKIDIKTRHFEGLKPFDNIQEIIKKSSKHEFHRHYGSIPKLSNSKFHSIIRKYYLNPRLLEIFEEANYYDVYEMKIDDDIKVLLECDDIKLIKILLIILLRLKNEYEIPQCEKWDLFFEILDNIKGDKDVENEEMNIETESLDIIYESFGYQMFLKLLNVQSLLSIKCDLIIDFLKEKKINEDGEKKKEINEIITKEAPRKRLLIHPLTVFSYAQNDYNFGINEKISITCECDGSDCLFSIAPKLPRGLSFYNKTGEIRGQAYEEVDGRRFVIDCSQKYTVKTFTMSLTIRAVFKNTAKSNGMIVNKSGRKVTCNDEQYNHCYFNLRLDKGIYHFKYKYIPSGRDFHSGFGVSIIDDFSDHNFCRNESSFCVIMDGNIPKNLYGLNQVAINRLAYRRFGFGNYNEYKYEFIVNMKECTISVKLENGEKYELFYNIPYILYPFVSLNHKGDSIELLSVYIED